jgi:hypothetical protein
VPPNPWSWEGIYDDILGQPVDVVADVPWALNKGMECNPEAVVLQYDELAIYCPSPAWLNRKGLEEMGARQVSAGETTLLTGLNGIDQIVGRDLGALFFATQIRDHDLLERMITTV